MFTAIVITLAIVAALGGLILTLRNSAKTGIPGKDVLDRASRRARELDSEEQADQDKGHR